MDPCLQIPKDIHFDKARESKNSCIQSGRLVLETTSATKLKVLILHFLILLIYNLFQVSQDIQFGDVNDILSVSSIKVLFFNVG